MENQQAEVCKRYLLVCVALEICGDTYGTFYSHNLLGKGQRGTKMRPTAGRHGAFSSR
jgi:hypothetical protein